MAHVTTPEPRKPTKETPPRDKGYLPAEELRKIDAYWRAANYLSVGQIYLLRQPAAARAADAASTSSRACSATGARRRGSTSSTSHLNRVIKEHDLDMIYVAGPGHGGPAIVANAYLEGTYSEVYPEHLAGRGRDEAAVQAVLVPRRHPQPRRARRRRARSTRAASSATRSRTPTAPRSTTRT